MIDHRVPLPDPPILRVVGELSERTGCGVQTALVALGDEPRIILDLSEVPFVDGGALSRLLGAIRRVTHHGRVVAVVCRGGIARALEAAGAAGRIPLASSVAHARLLLGLPAV